MIKNIVFYWLKNPDEEGFLDKETLVSWLREQEEIDVVQDVVLGTPMRDDWQAPPTRIAPGLGIEGTYDICSIKTLGSPEDVITYRDHPLHAKQSPRVREACREIR